MTIFPAEIPPGMPGRHWWWWTGPAGSVGSGRVGVYVAVHPARGPLHGGAPEHPLKLSLPEEAVGVFSGPSAPPLPL